MVSTKRVNLIIKRLENKEKLSIKKLSFDYEVSERTILRDLTNRIPNILEKPVIKKNGFYLLEDSSNNKDEMIIDILLQEAKLQGDTFYKDTVSLFNKFKKIKEMNYIYKQANSENIDDYVSQLLMLQRAIENEDCLSCDYKEKKRFFAPLKIANFDGFWYLILKDFDKKLINKYHLKSMKNIEIVTKRDFKKPCDVKLIQKLDSGINAFFDIHNDFFPVLLYVEKEVSQYFLRKPLSKLQRIVKIYDDTSLDLEIFITHEMEIIPTIQKYIPYVKVVEPEFIFKKIEENIKKML